MHSACHRRRSRHAFTLIELLVVIAIVALLMGVLLPALSAARRSADTVRCGSNLRQIAVLSGLYADSHSGRSPALGIPYGREPYWALVIQRMAGGEGEGSSLYRADSVLVCPAMDRIEPEDMTRTYGVNVTGLAGDAGDRADFDVEQTHARVDLVPRPSETVWYLDSESAIISGTAPPSTRTLGTIDFRNPEHVPARIGFVHGGDNDAFTVVRFDTSVRIERAVTDSWRTPLP